MEFISLKDKQVGFCKGCLVCQQTGNCVIKDDVKGIMDKVIDADIVVWATPIYYYEMSGQMKVLIDRLNPMFLRIISLEMFISLPQQPRMKSMYMKKHYQD